jgi:hypothetical protein
LARSGRDLLFVAPRKVLTPNLDVLAELLLDFPYYWESTAQPFDRKFTRQDRKELLSKFDQSNAMRTATA